MKTCKKFEIIHVFTPQTMFEMSIRNKLSGLGRVCVRISSLVCIINLLIAPVANVLMRLGYQDKGIEDFYRR